MPVDPTQDSILTRFRTALAEVYGSRLERVVLYGSRARGDQRPDSDYDPNPPSNSSLSLLFNKLLGFFDHQFGEAKCGICI